MKLSHYFIFALWLYSPLSWAYQVEEGQILNDKTEQIQLRGVNWFGFETENYVAHGLWARSWSDMIAQMQTLGFNAVRLPFCPATLKGQTPNSIDYSKNPDLEGLNSLEILDKVMAEFERQQIYVLLDHHRPDCKAISELWYTDSYSEADWIEDLNFIVKRYANNPYLLGIDLKNEPHGKATWGTNDNTDWRRAAERAASSLMQHNDKILFFVEGVGENPDCSSDTAHWWGGNLEPMRCYPLAIPKNRLVLSPHVYGPDVFAQDYFNQPDFPINMPAIWDQHFGFLLEQGYAVIFGEFGGRYGHGGKPEDVTWQNALVAYMRDKGMANYFYWSWNPNSGDTGGILQDDWYSVWDDKVKLLQTLQMTDDISPTPTATDGNNDGTTDNPPATTPAPVDDDTNNGTTTNIPPTTDKPAPVSISSANQACELSYVIDSQWQTGAVVRFTVNNHSDKPLYAWQVQWQLDEASRITDFWSVDLNRQGTAVTALPLDWNQQIPPQQATQFGMKIEGDAISFPEGLQLNAPLCDGTQIAPKNNENNADYVAGYQAGIAHCQQNPAACGLAGQFDDQSGGLFVPQIQIPGSRWRAQLKYTPVERCADDSNAILFQVFQLSPLTE